MKKAFLFMGISALLVCSAQSAIVITNNWESGVENWEDKPEWNLPNTVLTEEAAIGGETALQITGGTLSGDSASYIYDDNDGSGYSSVGASSLSFDFYSESGTPDGLFLYFNSSGTEWLYEISSFSAGWSHYDVNFTTSAGWYNMTLGSQTDLDVDLASIDEIGIILAYQPNIANQVYAIDDFNVHDTYFIPEPGTYAMLAFAFISLAITFRKNLNESIERALATVKITT
ncbi:MAG: hypothetical protein KAH23_06475 [Kiritimatiellae bacterium]|nr:hypothetical protein [Kiritimatiellia bacterium]